MSMVFEGFVVPDPIYAVPIVIAGLFVAIFLVALNLRITQRVALSFVPWMVLGGLLHVFYQMHLTVGEDMLPEPVAVYVSAPTVYLTVFVALGLVWGTSVLFSPSDKRTKRIARRVAGVGILLLIVALAFSVWYGFGESEFVFDPLYPTVGLLGAMGLTAVLYTAIALWRPYIVDHIQHVGALVIFAHAFDAMTTAVGIEFLDATERSTAPQAIIDFAADLPTEQYLGEAWLFVVVKMVVASVVVVLMHNYVRERPTEAYLFLLVIAAVGLGPATYNFFIFVYSVG
jgi:uncharacterized membrane protein